MIILREPIEIISGEETDPFHLNFLPGCKYKARNFAIPGRVAAHRTLEAGTSINVFAIHANRNAGSIRIELFDSTLESFTCSSPEYGLFKEAWDHDVGDLRSSFGWSFWVSKTYSDTHNSFYNAPIDYPRTY